MRARRHVDKRAGPGKRTKESCTLAQSMYSNVSVCTRTRMYRHLWIKKVKNSVPTYWFITQKLELCTRYIRFAWSTSGIPRKYRYGMVCQAYARNMPCRFECQAYAAWSAWHMSEVFLLIRMHVFLQWLFAVYRMFLLWDEDPILRSYMVLNKSMVYDWSMPCLCLVYS